MRFPRPLFDVLSKVIPPESLSVDYGGTAPPLPAPPQQGLPKTIGVAPKDLPKPPPKRSMARRMVSFAAAALSHEGKTSYQIGGRHAFVLVLGLWALVRRSATAAASALWAMAVALAAREWIGVPVTLASATIRVPLVHNPATVLNEQKKKQPESRTKWKTAKTEAAKVQHASSGSNSREEFARLERDRALGLGATGGGDGRGILAWGEGNRGGNSSENAIADANAEYGLSSLSVVGARLEIVDAVGMGQCGFDRFCVKVQVQVRKVTFLKVLIGLGGCGSMLRGDSRLFELRLSTGSYFLPYSEYLDVLSLHNRKMCIFLFAVYQNLGVELSGTDIQY